MKDHDRLSKARCCEVQGLPEIMIAFPHQPNSIHIWKYSFDAIPIELWIPSVPSIATAPVEKNVCFVDSRGWPASASNSGSGRDGKSKEMLCRNPRHSDHQHPWAHGNIMFQWVIHFLGDCYTMCVGRIATLDSG